MNVDGCRSRISRTTWINDRVVEAVLPDEVRWWRVGECAIGVDFDGSTLIGWQRDRTGRRSSRSRIQRSDDVAIRVRIVGTDRRGNRRVWQGFEVIILSDRWRVVDVGSWVNHVDR